MVGARILSLVHQAVGCLVIGLLFLPAASQAAEVTLKNGVRVEGALGKIGAMGESPLAAETGAGEVDVRLVVLVDDDLRRTFFSTYQVQELASPAPTPRERILVRQRVASSGKRIVGLGPIIRVTPFDDWGRRIFSMNTLSGQEDVVQGITEITPTYTKVEGLMGAKPYVWDMRIATSGIPRETLSRIMLGQIDRESADDRLRIVRLYIESDRYSDARTELEEIIGDFPELNELEEQVRRLRQLGAQRAIKEIELRAAAGQHRRAYAMLSSFPTEGVAGETLLRVSDMREEYERQTATRDQVLALLEQQIAELPSEEQQRVLQSFREELAAEVSMHTLPRMADYVRLAGSAELPLANKLALAVSGWLLGSGSGGDNLAVAVSQLQVRDIIRRYLTSTRKHERDAALAELASLEGSDPVSLAKILANMKPPYELPEPHEGVPGLFRLTAPGLTGEPDVAFFVQLPDEYDPYRRYPTIVTLNGAGTTPEQQIDWWAGSYNPNMETRLGQAARQGYIVIAPVWLREHQREYEYSAQEHAAVLNALRHSCRRFAIDTDRVYLSGHSIGGDAAWDMGLAHPDLWAGVLPIVATSDRYVTRYWENGRHVPFYFVSGELDGDKLRRNSGDWGRYLKRAGFDTMIVEYKGRGHEHFHDEIQHLFGWMQRHVRNFHPREFKVASMRPWDNFFWWVEVSSYPTPSMVAPAAWPPPSGARPAMTEATVLDSNGLSVKTAADRITFWLSPEIVDFNERMTIQGRRNLEIRPSAEVMLEDVRTRGDRLHPFWAKYSP